MPVDAPSAAPGRPDVTGTAPAVVLRAQALTKRFGEVLAVDGLSLDVHEGEVLGFLGPNGAGKTTSIKMLCGLLRPDSGTVLVGGKPITGGNAAVRRRVGVCPQEVVLWEKLTCLEQLEFMGEMYDLTKAEARRRGRRLLIDMGLETKSGALATALSGGMKRRLNFALALVHDPEIVVLDEPEAGLDPQSRIMAARLHPLAGPQQDDHPHDAQHGRG